MSATTTIIICGPSGSGKTSLAKAVQEALLPAMWLAFSVDSLFYSLPESVVERCNRKNDWSGVDGSAICSGALACLQALVKTGNRVIFDAVVTRGKSASQLLAASKDLNPFMVRLHCTWEEIQRRTVARGDRTLEEAEASFQKADDTLDCHLTINTTHLNAAEAAALVVENLKVWNPQSTV